MRCPNRLLGGAPTFRRQWWWFDALWCGMMWWEVRQCSLGGNVMYCHVIVWYGVLWWDVSCGHVLPCDDMLSSVWCDGMGWERMSCGLLCDVVGCGVLCFVMWCIGQISSIEGLGEDVLPASFSTELAATAALSLHVVVHFVSNFAATFFEPITLCQTPLLRDLRVMCDRVRHFVECFIGTFLSYSPQGR